MTTPQRNVLVVAPNWLGDAVMSLPLIGYFGAADVRVTVLANPYTARVYRDVPQVDDHIVMEKAGWSRRAWSRAQTVRRGGFDAAVLLTPSFSSALMVSLAGVPHRIGYASDGRSWLLTEAVPARDLRDEHLSNNYLRLGRKVLGALGIAAPEQFERASMVVSEDERAAANETLQACGVTGDYAVIVPGAVYGPTKKWPAEKFKSVAKELSASGDVVLTGTADDEATCEQMLIPGARVHSVAGKTGLGAFIALLAGARVVIANDSGAPHVSASVGVPTVAIFGSTSPTWTQPLGEFVSVVREPVPCSPCFRSECPTQLECFAGISPDRVTEAARTLVDHAGATSQ